MMKAPRSIGEYRVITLIGVGASSSVYRAVRAADDVQVAIKVLADNHSAMAESRRRFTDEWKLLARVDHPSIATIYDAGETDDGQPYMVLELANRGDLRTRVGDLAERGFRIGETDVRAVAEHLRDSLSALHGEGVVHRDISPSNILIRGDSANGRPPMSLHRSLLEPGERFLLSDLGFAKRLADASGLTRGGGTEGFAAPEQRSAVSIVDQRSDLFSATALIRWLAADTPVAERLSDFVATGTADDPDDRHDDIEAWYDDLDRALTSGVSPLPGVAQWASVDDGAPAIVGDGTGRGPLGRALGAIPGLRGQRGAVAALAVLAAAAAVALLAWPSPTDDTTRTGADPASPTDQDQEAAGAEGSSDREGSTVPSADSSNRSSTDTPDDQVSPSSTEAPTSTSSIVGSTGSTSDPSPASSTPTPTPTSTSTSTSTGSTTSATGNPTSSPPTTSPSTAGPTTTTGPTTTAAPSTTRSTTPSTTGPSTTVNPFPFSPRAYIEDPAAGAAVSGALVISGTVQSPDGVGYLELVVRHEESGDYWHDDPGAFQDEFIRFRVEVAQAGETETAWSYRIPAADLRPGTYRLRVWGRSVDGSGDPVSDFRTVTVTN